MILHVVNKTIIFLILMVTNIYSMDCSNYSNFTKYDGKFYSMSTSKLTFESAKQIAINNGGTLAIPNDQNENDFIQSLIGGGSVSWIGIYDPNKIENHCFEYSLCSYDSTRFKDVNNEFLMYKNFHPNQPDNLLKEYDIIDGKTMVSPLGEFWVAMSGQNGLWMDSGNHAEEYNNPVKYKAVFEFENLNECTPSSDDDEKDLSGRFCNTKVWDETVDIVTMGKTVDCLNDSYGNEYCPESLAKAGEYWTYNDGWSTSHTGVTKTYTSKVTSSYSASVASSFSKPLWSDGMNRPSTAYNGRIYGYLSSTSFPNSKPLWSDGMNRPSTAYNGRIYGYLSSTPKTTYSCPNGGLLSGNTCYKSSCPNTYSTTSGEEIINGECIKKVNYTYYKYLCKNENNNFNQNWIISDSGGAESLNSIPPVDNCKRKEFTCNSNLREPAYINNEWLCSPFPCLGTSNLEKINTDIGKNDNNNDGWEEDGSCNGKISIFSGKGKSCRSWDMFLGLVGGGCCDKDKVAAGLVSCKADEKLLAKKREKKHTHKVGNYCSKELNLLFTKICIQKSDSYCTFNSLLSRIINEQGRVQIGKGWGSAESPDCSGFTPEEFQKLDFSQIDLSEFVSDLQGKIKTDVFNNLGTFIKDKVTGFYEN